MSAGAGRNRAARSAMKSTLLVLVVGLSAAPAGAYPVSFTLRHDTGGATITITPAPGVTTVQADAEGVVPARLFIRLKAIRST